MRPATLVSDNRTESEVSFDRLQYEEGPSGEGPDLRFCGADDGIRTRDPNLGKVVLYQLSHVRVGDEDSAPGTLAQVPARRATTGANCS